MCPCGVSPNFEGLYVILVCHLAIECQTINMLFAANQPEVDQNEPQLSLGEYRWATVTSENDMCNTIGTLVYIYTTYGMLGCCHKHLVIH